METLPKGWGLTKLSDIVIYGKGKKPKILLKSKFEGSVPYINIKAFEQGVIDEYADISSSKLIDEDCILVVWDGARFGLAGIGIKGAAGSTLMVLKPVVCYRDYIYNFVNRHYTYINSNPKGAATPHVNPDIFWGLKLPTAPINEQKRIVAKLDKIIPRVDAVKERLVKIPTIIKRFRQSVLTAAVTGKLTEKWREEHPDVESAEVLLDKTKIIRHYTFKEKWNDFNIPHSWKCTFLKEIADLRLGKMLDKSKNKGEKVDYLRNINVRWFEYDLDDIKKISITKLEEEKLSVKPGDVFICEGGEPGRAAVWKKDKGKMTFQKALHRVRFNILFIPELLVYNLKVDADSQKLRELFTGSTIKHFTGRSLAKYPIPLPPLEEQKEIVRQVEKLFAIADKLEEHYQKAKAKVDKLSQSILAKAFRGELVVNEAELAEKEGRDFESAVELLERIKEEKAKMEAELKASKKRARKKK